VRQRFGILRHFIRNFPPPGRKGGRSTGRPPAARGRLAFPTSNIIRGWPRAGCMMMISNVATQATTMAMLWRRTAWWFISFAVAVVLAVSMRSAGFDQSASFTVALVVWVILPFVISKDRVLFILGRMHRRVSRADGPAEKIAQAPQEQVAGPAQHLSSEFIRRAKAGARTIVKSRPIQRAIAMLPSRK